MKRLLPLLLLLISSAATAESGAYRIEVIIFQNLGADADTVQVESLRSFSGFPALEESNLPDDLVVLVKKSSTMDTAWRRLKSSKAYRPLLFAAWEQNRTDYYPPMRLHDKTVLDEQLRPPTSIMIADLAAAEPLAAYVSTFYQLDGTVQLRRSRFLHIYVDLEYREAVTQDAPQTTVFTVGDPLPPGVSAADNADDGDIGISPDRNIYSLQQNRQVRTGRMQYFDMPYFGVLVLVSAIDSEQQAAGVPLAEGSNRE